MTSDSASAPLTQLLHQWQDGNDTALEPLFRAATSELRRIAGALFRNERGTHTLQPTAIVNEAFIRLIGIERMEWQDREHFFAFAATAMRRVLVDHARTKGANKRGGDWIKTELPLGVSDWTDPIDLLTIEAALEALQAVDSERAEIATLRFFAGLTNAEIADLKGVSERTVKRKWRLTRAWLESYLGAR